MSKKITKNQRFILLLIIVIISYTLGAYTFTHINSCNEQYDAGWHSGYTDGTSYWNLTSDEQMIINEHRIRKLDNNMADWCVWK